MASLIWRITRNSSQIFLGRFTNLLLNFVAFILLANYLGPDLFGRLTFAIAFVGFFDAISNFGINQITLREISKENRNSEEILSQGLLLKFLFSLIAFISCDIGIVLLGYSREIINLVWIISFNFFISAKLSSFRKFLEVIFQRKLKMGLPVFFSVSDNLLFLTMILILLKHKIPMMWLAIIYTATNVPGFLLMIWQFFKKAKLKFILNRNLLKYFLRETFPVFLLVSFSSLILRIDVFLLSQFQTESDIGLYNAATRLFIPLPFLQLAISASLYPLFASYYKTDPRKFKTLFHVGFNFLMLVSLFLGSIYVSYGNQIIQLIYKPEYIRSAIAIKIFGPAIFFMSVMYFGVDLSLAIGIQRHSALALFITMIINLGLNVVMIPSLSFEGASIAKLCSFIAGAFFIYYFLQKEIPLFTFKQLLKYFVFIAAISVFTIILAPINIFLFSGIAMVVFLILAFSLGIIDLGKIRLLRETAL